MRGNILRFPAPLSGRTGQGEMKRHIRCQSKEVTVLIEVRTRDKVTEVVALVVGLDLKLYVLQCGARGC